MTMYPFQSPRSPLDSQTQPEPRPGILRLVFQGRQRRREDRGGLFLLARAFGLDVWGNYLLNRRAAKEMGSAALLLCVVLLFELLAWSMLFNVLVHSADWRLSLRTVFALLLGGVFSAGIFLFEKSFITSDFREAALQKSLAYSIRLVIIAGSALATAQPIELLVFGGAIERRLHEENVLAEAVRQIGEVLELERKAQPKKEGELQQELMNTMQYTDLQTAKLERDALKVHIGELESRLPGLREAVTRADREIERAAASRSRANRALNAASTESGRAQARRDLTYAENWLAAARSRKANAASQLASVQEELQTSNLKLGVIEGNVTTYEGKYQKKVDEERGRDTARSRVSEVELKNRKEWMKIVQGAKPGEEIVNPQTHRVLHPKPADFTERLRVLDDLRTGRPAQWPSTSDEARNRAVELFGLDDPEGPPSESRARNEQRRTDDATLFRSVYRVAFIMACVIPLLTVAFKLLMAGELKVYYSTLAQARAGNPEAIDVIRARGKNPRDLFDPPDA